jgi:hypothetical protein
MIERACFRASPIANRGTFYTYSLVAREQHCAYRVSVQVTMYWNSLYNFPATSLVGLPVVPLLTTRRLRATTAEKKCKTISRFCYPHDYNYHSYSEVLSSK